MKREKEKSMESEIVKNGEIVKNVKNDVFPKVWKRTEERKNYLSKEKPSNALGLEGWFMVQIINALVKTEHEVEEFRYGDAPDLKLRSGIEIELKGATDFRPKYIKEGVKYQTL